MHKEENVIEKFHPHPIHFFGFYFIGIVALIIGVLKFWPLIIFGLLLFLLANLLQKAETFYLLESGVARGYNLLSTSRKFTEYDKIQNIEVRQSFLENIIGIGSVKFDTSGSHTVEVAFLGVKSPYAIERKVRAKMALD